MDSMGKAADSSFHNDENFLMIEDFHVQKAERTIVIFTVSSLSLKNQHAIRIL